MAPLAVDINNQNKGIGSKLVLKGHYIAKNLGYNTIVVLGDYKYYNCFGYFPAKNIGIFPPFDVPNENFMVYQLSDKKIFNNTIEYAKEFFE